jgi:hypothetical protein
MSSTEHEYLVESLGAGDRPQKAMDTDWYFCAQDPRETCRRESAKRWR